MSAVDVSPALGLTLQPLARLETDLLVVPAFDGEDVAAALPDLDAAAGGEIRAAQGVEFRQGGPGASHENAKEPLHVEKPPADDPQPRHSKISGMIPISRKRPTLCCVGLVFCSPADLM